jgi:hypothetical protein
LSRHGYSENEIEEAVLYRKPIASRALYTLIERRLHEGLGWPDPTYNVIMNAHSSLSINGVGALADGSSDVVVLDKLVRFEPLLPGRRAAATTHLLTQQVSPPVVNGHKLVREKSNFAFDEQVLLQPNTNGLTQEAYNELVAQPRLNSRKVYHDMIIRRPSAVGSSIDTADEYTTTRRIQNANNLAPIKPMVSVQRGSAFVSQQQQQQQQPHKMKPRSLPNSTLDHANQNGFHLPHDPLAGGSNGSRTPKNLSRISHIDHSRKTQQHSPVRYNPGRKILFLLLFQLLGSSSLFKQNPSFNKFINIIFLSSIFPVSEKK